MPVADSDVSEILMDDTEDSPRLDEEVKPTRRRSSPEKRHARRVVQRQASRPSSDAKILAAGFAQLFGAFSLALGLMVLSYNDYEAAMMTTEEAQGMAKLPARVFGRSRFAQQIIGAVPWIGDVTDFVFSGLSWWMRVYPLIVLRQAQNAAAQRAQKGQPYVAPTGATAVQGPSAQPKPASNGASSPPASLANIAGAGYADPDQLAAWNHTNVSADYRSVTQ